MQIILVGMTLALAAQVAGDSRYAAAGQQGSPAASNGSELSVADESPAAATNAGAGQEAASSGTQPELAAEHSQPEAAAAPLNFQAEPAAGGQPEPATPQRSVLAAFAKPSDLMRQFMKPPAAGQLLGVPVTLGEAVADARSRQDQTVRAKAYWDLAGAVGDYQLAVLENIELGALRQAIASPAKQWDLRQREARGRVDIARRAAQGAQLRLHRLLGRSDGAPLPLPGDAPHCGRYNAEYEEIFAARPDPIARQLSELMPLRYADLRSQAQAIAEATAWRDEMSHRRHPADDGLELLNSQDLLSLKRRAFVMTARDYNQEIAQYTELAAPAEVAPDRLVAMMIRTSAQQGDLPWQSRGVQQASAEEPAAPSAAALAAEAQTKAADESNGQRTFAEGFREVRRPLQRLLDRDREHSILRRPIQRLRHRND
jgi:hypothetical protein